MIRRQINVNFTSDDRKRLEAVVNSPKSAKIDRLKAQVLLLSDAGKEGPGILCKDIAPKLGVSETSVKRIRQAYVKNLSIDEVFSLSSLGNYKSKTNADDIKTKPKLKLNKRYVEIDDLNITFLVENVKCKVVLAREEREQLEKVIKSGKQTKRKFNRATILLLADEGHEGPALTDQEISNKLDVSLSTVSRVRKLFITQGNIDEVLNFNHNKAGRPPKIDGNVQANLIALACSAPPKGRCRWTLKLLADQLVELKVVDSISSMAVGTALKKTNLNLGSAKSG